MHFQDIANPVRRQKALLALGIQAKHLHNELLPNLADTGFTPKDMIDLLGMRFGAKGLGPANSSWKARDLVALGWKAPDLCAAGMVYLEQFASLDPDDADEAALGFTVAQIDALPMMNAPVVATAENNTVTIVIQQPPRQQTPIQVPVFQVPTVTRHHGLRK